MADTKEFMITTVDNPYNPFTHWPEWFAFDVSHGYRSCEMLGRFAKTSINISDEDNRLEINRAIDEIIKYDLRHVFTKVEKAA